MKKETLAFTGILLFSLGVFLGLYLWIPKQSAISKDFRPLPPTGGGGPCGVYLVEAQVSKRTMLENESQALTVEIGNLYGEDCKATVNLNAPNFDIAPNENEQTVTFPGKGNSTVIWILTPKMAGVFEVSIEVERDSQIIGIGVTNLLGLSPTQAQIISYVGSFFGPMLTAPWWYEKLKERQGKSKKVSRSKPKK